MPRQRIKRVFVQTLQYAGTFVGNVTGNVTGTLTGNVTGDVTGNVTGNIAGKIADSGFLAVSADGAIAVPSQDTVYFITKGTAAALTIVDPTATTHDNRKLTFVSTTAAAHTLDNS